MFKLVDQERTATVERLVNERGEAATGLLYKERNKIEQKSEVARGEKVKTFKIKRNPVDDVSFHFPVTRTPSRSAANQE